jgi:hypothetical protein
MSGRPTSALICYQTLVVAPRLLDIQVKTLWTEAVKNIPHFKLRLVNAVRAPPQPPPPPHPHSLK